MADIDSAMAKMTITPPPLRLFGLALNGSVPEVEAALEEDPGLLNVPAQSGLFAGRTLLHCAASRGHATLVRALLARGARDMADQSGSTAAALAAKAGHAEVSALLVPPPAPTEEAPPTKETPRFKEALDGFTSRYGTNVPPKKFVELKVRRGAELMAQLIRAAAECDSIIAGGAVRWMCSPLSETMDGKNGGLVGSNDVDIFPPSNEKLEALEARLLDMGYSRLEDERGDMARTYRKPSVPKPAGHVQLVVPRRSAFMNTSAGTAAELLETLDFTVARAALLSASVALVDADFEHDERRKLLRIRHIVCPISAVRRIAKYTAKGYHCRMLEIVKLFAEWSERARAEQAAPEAAGGALAKAPDDATGQTGAPQETEVTPAKLLEALSRVPVIGGEDTQDWVSEIYRGANVD